MQEDCVKLTSYLSERRPNGMVTSRSLARLYGEDQIAAGIVLRARGDSWSRHRLRDGAAPDATEELPTVATVVGSRPRIEAVLEQALKLSAPTLVTVGRATLLSGDIDPVGLWDGPDDATKLTVYCSDRDRIYQVPAFEVISELLHRRGIPGATVLVGLNGDDRRGGGRGRTADRYGTPMVVTAIGSGQQLGVMLPEIGGLLRQPRITIEKVRVCKRGGRLISPPQEVPETQADGRTYWHKLTVYACDSARHDGRSIHQVIRRRIRLAGLGSAVTLRGIWGFRGERVPHGGVHLPGVTIVIDPPERISAAFALIDELTAKRGLVTSEMVAAVRRAPFTTRSHRLPSSLSNDPFGRKSDPAISGCEPPRLLKKARRTRRCCSRCAAAWCSPCCPPRTPASSWRRRRAP